MGELGALFNPGMRHELEERQAKAARREEEGNARDGDLRIDLESGVAVINVAGTDAHEVAAEAEDATEAADANGEPAAAAAAPAGEPVAHHPNAKKPSDDATTNAEQDGPPAPTVRPRGKRGLSHSAH